MDALTGPLPDEAGVHAADAPHLDARRAAGRRRRVVVVGAGFGGLACARELLEADDPPAVTVVDQRNFHTFLPLLYQVATAGLNSADVAYPVRGILRRHPTADFRQGTVEGVDWEARELRLDGEAALPFDDLVVAAGARVNWFGTEGAEEHGSALYTLDDAVALRNHVLECFEAASADPSLLDDGALTCVVVGGGPTGVEMAGALSELFEGVLRRDFPHLDVGRARVVLVEAADTLLRAFSAPSREHAVVTLRARGVEVRLGEGVDAIGATRVRLAGGDELAAHTVVWAAGVQAGGLADRLGVEQGPAGRIVVGPDLRIAGRPGAWAIGDIAHILDPDTGRALPQLAQVAIQGGRHVARELTGRADGSSFRYHDKGTMATIGRRAAVAELPHVPPLRGTLAWFAWLGLHLVTLMGMRNRLSVLVNWAWSYLTWDRGPRLIFGDRGRDRRPDPHLG